MWEDRRMNIPGPSCPGEKFSCVELMKQVMTSVYTNGCIWESGGNVSVFKFGCLCKRISSCIYGWVPITIPRWKSGHNLKECFLSFHLRRCHQSLSSSLPTHYQKGFCYLWAGANTRGCTFCRKIYSGPLWRLVPSLLYLFGEHLLSQYFH